MDKHCHWILQGMNTNKLGAIFIHQWNNYILNNNGFSNEHHFSYYISSLTHNLFLNLIIFYLHIQRYLCIFLCFSLNNSAKATLDTPMAIGCAPSTSVISSYMDSIFLLVTLFPIYIQPLKVFMHKIILGGVHSMAFIFYIRTRIHQLFHKPLSHFPYIILCHDHGTLIWITCTIPWYILFISYTTLWSWIPKLLKDSGIWQINLPYVNIFC